VTPTRVRTLVMVALLVGVLGYLLAETAYGSLVSLPYYASATAVVIAVFEAGLGKLVRDKLRGRGRGRPMHPLQVARAAALAKASAAAGALLLGLYGGLLAWTATHLELAAARHDALAAGASAAACLALAAAALLLERSCRTPAD
jgi:hypothetical protein